MFQPKLERVIYNIHAQMFTALFQFLRILTAVSTHKSSAVAVTAAQDCGVAMSSTSLGEQLAEGPGTKSCSQGATSGWWPVTSGVPRGSILRSVLFNVCINDPITGIECMLRQFEDDS